MRRRDLVSSLSLGLLQAGGRFTCPMDPDVRRPHPGKCPRCGMDLRPSIPDFEEYPLKVTTSPSNWRPGAAVHLTFEVLDPKAQQRVTNFEIVHERLFHLFLVSGDLGYFLHEHPEQQRDGTFVIRLRLPKSGYYRVLGDFFPKDATPQMAVKTIFSAGSSQIDFARPRLTPDTAAKSCANLQVALRTEPDRPLAGLKTMLFFELSPSSGIEPYLGAQGHLLAASDDLIDLIHAHPFLVHRPSSVKFNVTFPRPGLYRLWSQFQRAGVVNTARFTVPVRGL
jgi:hypothetical protein